METDHYLSAGAFHGHAGVGLAQQRGTHSGGFRPGLPDPDAVSAIMAGTVVLLVEDEAIIAFDLQTTLEECGAEVAGPYGLLRDSLYVARNAPRIDAAILDVNLHGEAVYPVAEVLKERGVPVVFHTAYSLPAEVRETFPDARICTKPSLPETILGNVAQMILDRS